MPEPIDADALLAKQPIDADAIMAAQPPQRYLPVMAGSKPAGMRPVSEDEYQASMGETETGLKGIALAGASSLLPAAGAVAPGVLGSGLRFAASPTGVGITSTAIQLARGQDPATAARDGLLTAIGLKALPVGARAVLNKVATKFPTIGEALAAYAARAGAPAETAATSLDKWPPSLVAAARDTPEARALLEASGRLDRWPASLREMVGSEATPTAGATAGLPAEMQGLPINPDGTVTLRTSNGGTFNLDPNRAAQLRRAATPSAGGPTAPAIPINPAVDLMNSAIAKAKELNARGFSQGQVVSALRDTHGLPAGAARRIVEAAKATPETNPELAKSIDRYVNFLTRPGAEP